MANQNGAKFGFTGLFPIKTDEHAAALRTLLRALGAHNAPNSLLLSYLLFERGFTREMVDMGYQDAKVRSAEIRDFLQLENARRFRAARS